MARFDPGAYNDDIYFENLRSPVLANRIGPPEEGAPTVASMNRLFPAYGLRSTPTFTEEKHVAPARTPTTRSLITRGTTRLGPGGVSSPRSRLQASTSYGSSATQRPGESFVVRRAPMPEYPTEELGAIQYPSLNIPSLTMPERDPERVAELTERAFRPGESRLRKGTKRALRIAEDAPTPFARRMQASGILAGLGEGIGSLRERAVRAGLSEYEPEYRAKVGKATGEYEAGYRGAIAKHGAAVSDAAQQRQEVMNRYLAAVREWESKSGG